MGYYGHRPYMAHTGVVRSLRDGEEHIVRAGRVADLYGVPKNLCVMIDEIDELRGYNVEEYVHLVPRNDGDYGKHTIPERGVVPNE